MSMAIAEFRQKLKLGEVSARELVEQKLQRISAVDKDLNSFLTITSDRALADADRIDEARSAGDDLPPFIATNF